MKHVLYLHVCVGGVDAPKRKAWEPHPDADCAWVEGSCPACKHDFPDSRPGFGDAKRFRIAGMGRRIASDDRHWEADAVALCCNKPIGLIRLEVSTLFGIREDQAVLQGRCRVY